MCGRINKQTKKKERQMTTRKACHLRDKVKTNDCRLSHPSPSPITLHHPPPALHSLPQPPFSCLSISCSIFTPFTSSFPPHSDRPSYHLTSIHRSSHLPVPTPLHLLPVNVCRRRPSFTPPPLHPVTPARSPSQLSPLRPKRRRRAI